MLKRILADREFLNTIRKIAIPVTLQALIMSGLNTLDTFMITKLGTASIAGVGIANQVFFFYNFFLFGLNTGAAILFSQYYGKNDSLAVKKTLGCALRLSALISVAFTLVAFIFSNEIVSVFNDEVNVVREGGNYLRAVSLSYIITAFSYSISVGMRSTGNPRTPLVGSIFAFVANVFFNYCFIFGKCGMPRLGVVGAAVGTIIARALELGIIMYVLFTKKSILYKNMRTLFERDMKFSKHFLVIVFPVLIEEIFWSLSQVIYNFAYAKLGESATASVVVASSISGMLYIFARGLASASGVLIGIKVGENSYDRAMEVAKESLAASVMVGLVLGAILFFLPEQLLWFFKDLTPEVHDLTVKALRILGIFITVRVYNSIGIVGVIRNGGDVQFSLKEEMFTSYCVGVPLALLGVYVFKLELPGVMALIAVEEIVKALISTPRIMSRKWMKNVANE